MVTIKFLGGREVKRKKTKKCRGIKIVYIVWPGTDRRLYQLWSWWWPEITGGERVLRYSSNLCPSCCLQQKMISTRGKVQGAVCIACYGCGTESVSHVTGEDNMWLEILFHDLFSQTSQALLEEVGSEYIQLFLNLTEWVPPCWI